MYHFGTGNFQKQGVSWIAISHALMTKRVIDTTWTRKGDLRRLKTKESKQKYYLASECWLIFYGTTGILIFSIQGVVVEPSLITHIRPFSLGLLEPQISLFCVFFHGCQDSKMVFPTFPGFPDQNIEISLSFFAANTNTRGFFGILEFIFAPHTRKTFLKFSYPPPSKNIGKIFARPPHYDWENIFVPLHFPENVLTKHMKNPTFFEYRRKWENLSIFSKSSHPVQGDPKFVPPYGEAKLRTFGFGNRED